MKPNLDHPLIRNANALLILASERHASALRLLKIEHELAMLRPPGVPSPGFDEAQLAVAEAEDELREAAIAFGSCVETATAEERLREARERVFDEATASCWSDDDDAGDVPSMEGL